MANVQYADFKKVIIDELTQKADVQPDDIYIHHYRHNTLIGLGQKPHVQPIVDINYDTKFLVSINMKFLKDKLNKADQRKIANITNAYMKTLWHNVNPPFDPNHINDDGAIN